MWITAIGITCAGLIVLATVWLLRHREKTRRIGREAEKLDVTPRGVRSAFWFTSADDSDSHHGSDSSGGGDDS